MRLALPVIVAVLLLLAALGEARPLGGADWAAAGGTPLPGASTTMAQALRRLYTQRLGGPGASCTTNSPNIPCPPKKKPKVDEDMAVARRTMRLALPLILAALMLLAVLGEARPLGGADWAAAGGTPLPAVVQALRRLYMQQLGGPGPSCGTNSPNVHCP
ncbi:hypothetical protein ZWY2020_049452 [Hordeum vulgare]|nr:hypothetical protein ZWY2020_049452 [Hordeum vulgare]